MRSKTTRKPPATGPRALHGSAEARRAAAILLQVLGGLKTTQAGSDELGVAVPRYYVLETRALQAMIDALEPRPRGRQTTAASELAALRKDHERLQRELLRAQALHRATQRTVDALELPTAKRKRKAKASVAPKKKVRRVRRKSRGERILAELQQTGSTMPSSQGGGCDGGGPTEQGSLSRGRTGRSGDRAAAAAGDPGDNRG